MATPPEGPTRCDPQHLLTHLGWLRSLARQLVSDQQVAEDLAQDACIIALEGRPSDPARMRGWLTGTLERLVFKHLRSERRRLEHESDAAQRETLEETEALVEQVEAQGELVRLVLSLDEPYRDVILYYHFEDLSWSDIAHRLGISTPAVKSRLQRAHAQLRKRLERSLGKDPRVWSLLLLGSPFDAGGALLSNSGGLLMGTKLTVAGTVLATATLLTYLALGPGGGDLRGPSSVATIEAGRQVPREPEVESAPQSAAADQREAIAETVATPVPAAENEPQPAPAGPRSRDQWLLAIEGALAGDVDLAGFVELGTQIAELPADASVRPQPQLGGAVAYPLLDTPEGVSAEFEVARPSNVDYQDPLLSLRLEIEPPQGPYLVSGSARRPPEVQLTVYADPSGKPLKLAITADFQLDTAANRGLGVSASQGRTPMSIHFSYDVADPLASKAYLSWLEGDTMTRGPIDWRFVGRQVTSQSLEDLLARLHLQHAALYE